MRATRPVLDELLQVKVLQELCEVGFYLEWDRPRGETALPVSQEYFEAKYVDDPRFLALITPKKDVVFQGDYSDQEKLLSECDWLDCYSRVVLITVPHQDRDKKQQQIYDKCMSTVAVMYTDDDVDVFVIHRADDLYKIVLDLTFAWGLEKRKQEKDS